MRLGNAGEAYFVRYLDEVPPKSSGLEIEAGSPNRPTEPIKIRNADDVRRPSLS